MFTQTKQYFLILKSELNFSHSHPLKDSFSLIILVKPCCGFSVPVHHALVETPPRFQKFQGWWRSELEEEETLDLDPDVPLADKDDEKEEPSQHVAGIQNPEGYLDELAVLTGLIEMVVDKEVNSLNAPQNAKDQEQFHVQDLKYRVFDDKCRKL